MLTLALTVPVVARRRRASGFPPPPLPAVFPGDAFAYWEGQGQSNMTGFNEVGDAPAHLRVVNEGAEMMTDAPGWRPYVLLDVGETATAGGVTYDGKVDEVEIPPAAGGAGPLIGLHEAMIDGAMDQEGALIPAAVLMGKFADAGKLLNEFLPDYDDGTPPLGGANFNARNNVLPGLLRARLSEGPIFAQGKIWMHGEANASAAAGPGAPEIADYAAGLSRLRAFDRAQFGTPNLPYYLCAIADKGANEAALNVALASLCRWRVAPDGVVTDQANGGDATSYFIDHGQNPAGDVHFDMTEMRAIGALVWTAQQHHAGIPEGLTEAHPILAINPVHQRPPSAAATSDSEIAAEVVVNEDGTAFAVISPAGSPAPSEASVIAAPDASAPCLRGRVGVLSFTGLDPETAYDVWIAYEAASGDRAGFTSVTATTDAAPATAWSPADAGALFWFDAQDAATVAESGGEVTGWTDKGANAVTVASTDAASRPTYAAGGINGFPALDFDGGDDLTGDGVALGPDMCLLVVAEVDLVTNGSEAILDLQGQNIAIRANNNSQFRGRFELQNGTNVNINPSPIADYAGAAHLFLGRYDSAAGRVEVWIDGVEVGASANYATPVSGPDNIRLMRPYGTSLKLGGKLGEAVAIASAATADRERLEGYAAHRWGVADLLPAGHPYKSAAP